VWTIEIGLLVTLCVSYFFLLISFHHPSSHALLWGCFVVVSRSYVVRFVVFCLVVFNYHVCFLSPPRAHHTLRLSLFYFSFNDGLQETHILRSLHVVPARLGARLRKSFWGSSIQITYRCRSGGGISSGSGSRKGGVRVVGQSGGGVPQMREGLGQSRRNKTRPRLFVLPLKNRCGCTRNMVLNLKTINRNRGTGASRFRASRRTFSLPV
jgi:hypothetical protein